MDIRIPRVTPPGPIILVRWCVPDGSRIEADEPVCELETEKASVELPAQRSGILEQLVPAGTVVERGTLIGRIR